MESLELFLNNLITTDKYDERLARYIKEFFLYNAKYFGWDRDTIREKEELLQKRVRGFEFVYLSNRTSEIDYDSKNILLNSRIKQINYDRNSGVALIAEIFSNLDTLSRRPDTDRPDVIDDGKYTRDLKYCVNQKEKERIMSIITADTNKSIDKIYDLNYEYSHITYPNSILKTDDPTENLYTYLCWYESILDSFKVDSFFWSLQRKEPAERKKETVQKFKKISLIIQKIMEEEKENIPDSSDPRFEKFRVTLRNIKTKINVISEEIKSDLSEPIIDEETDIDNFRQSIPEYFIHSVRPEFKPTELTDNYLIQKSTILAQNYQDKFRPIIIEYFVRSAKIYNWSKEEFDKKVRNFSINCKRIEYLKRREEKDGLIGFWLQNKSKVEVKIKEMKADSILAIFFHEFEHATDVAKRGRVTYEDAMLDNINETATEIGAVMMMGEKPYYDKLNFFINMHGYGYSRQAVGMMSAALGISEFEFARMRDNGILEADFVDKYKYINILDVFKEYDKILGEIFTTYRDDRKGEESQILSAAYLKMFKLATKVLNRRKEYENRTLTKEARYLANDKSRYETIKLAKNIKDAIMVYKLKGIDENGFIEKNTKLSYEEARYFSYILRLTHYYDYQYFDNADIYRHIRDEIKYPIIGKFKKTFARITNTLLLPEGEELAEEDDEIASTPDMMRDANEFKTRIKYSPKKGLLQRRSGSEDYNKYKETTKDIE